MRPVCNQTEREKIMWLSVIVVGFIVGLTARFIHPGADRLGLIMTTLLGIGGAVVASWAGQVMGLYRHGQPAGWLASIAGSVVILAVASALRGR